MLLCSKWKWLDCLFWLQKYTHWHSNHKENYKGKQSLKFKHAEIYTVITLIITLFPKRGLAFHMLISGFEI